MNSLVSLTAALLIAGQPPLPESLGEGKLLTTIRQAQEHGGTLRGSPARRHYRAAVAEVLAETRCPVLTDVLESAVADSERTDDDAAAAEALRAGLAEAEKLLRLRSLDARRAW